MIDPIDVLSVMAARAQVFAPVLANDASELSLLNALRLGQEDRLDVMRCVSDLLLKDCLRSSHGQLFVRTQGVRELHALAHEREHDVQDLLERLYLVSSNSYVNKLRAYHQDPEFYNRGLAIKECTQTSTQLLRFFVDLSKLVAGRHFKKLDEVFAELDPSRVHPNLAALLLAETQVMHDMPNRGVVLGALRIGAPIPKAVGMCRVDPDILERPGPARHTYFSCLRDYHRHLRFLLRLQVKGTLTSRMFYIPRRLSSDLFHEFVQAACSSVRRRTNHRTGIIYILAYGFFARRISTSLLAYEDYQVMVNHTFPGDSALVLLCDKATGRVVDFNQLFAI